MSSTENSSSGQPQQHLTNASTTTYYKEVVTLNEASCVFYSIVSVSATLCNGAVLLAIYKDPRRCFRGPRAFFMAVALLCGLVNGGLLAPLTAYGFKLNINSLPSWEKETNLQHGLEVSTVCLSTLSLTVLLIYSWHQAKITSSRRKVRTEQPGLSIKQSFACMACILTYSILLAFSPFFGNLAWLKYQKLHLHLNLTLGSALLIVIYMRIYLLHIRDNNSIYEVRFNSIDQVRIDHRRERDERQYTILTLFLIIVQLVFTLPFIIGKYFELYYPLRTEKELIRVLTARQILEKIFFLKYVAMPVVFILGSRRHREAFHVAIQRLN